MKLRYPGRCSLCGADLPRGTMASWDSKAKVITCDSCTAQPADAPEQDSAADAGETIEVGVAGSSALREYERRKARREERVKKNFGNFLGGVVLAVTDDPHSTRAWGQGAGGEEKLAQAIARLGRDDVIALHDRSVPASRANIDHVVIAPSGVYVIDSKHYQGEVTVRDIGGLFRTDKRLFVGHRDCTKLAMNMSWQIEAVSNALAAAAFDPRPAIIPVLAFIDAEWPLLFPPSEYAGVKLEGKRSILKQLTAPGPADVAQVRAIARAIAVALPAK